MTRFDVVAVGVSWGGLHALSVLVAGLPARFPAAVAVVQHRGVDSEPGALAGILSGRGPLEVREVDDKDAVVPGRVHLAPADYHLLVERDGFALSTDERVSFSRPSVDVLFESAADVYGPRLIGVVLTGANEDGAAGVRRIKARGGVTFAEDPETAERPDMPRAAIATGAVDRVLPLAAIAPALVELCEADVTREAVR